MMNKEQQERAEEFIAKMLDESDPPPTVHQVLKALHNNRLHARHELVLRMRQRKLLELATASKPLTHTIGDHLQKRIAISVAAVKPEPKPEVKPTPYQERPVAQRSVESVIQEVTGTTPGSNFTDEQRAKGVETNQRHAQERRRFAEDAALQNPNMTGVQLVEYVRTKFGVGIDSNVALDILKTARSLQPPKPPEPAKVVVIHRSKPVEAPTVKFVDDLPKKTLKRSSPIEEKAKLILAELMNNPGKWAIVGEGADPESARHTYSRLQACLKEGGRRR